MAFLFRMPTCRCMDLYFEQNTMVMLSPRTVHSLIDLRLVYPGILALVKLVAGRGNCVTDLHYTGAIFGVAIYERVTNAIVDPLYKLGWITAGAICNKLGELLFEAVRILKGEFLGIFD